MRRIVLSAVLLASAFSGACAQDVRLTASLEKTQYRVGDWIPLTVEARMSSAVTSIQPLAADSLPGGVEILRVEAGNSETDGGVRKQVWQFRLTSFDSGDVVIAPIPFGYRVKGDTALRRAVTNPVRITTTTAVVDPKGDIRDIKPPESAPWKFEDFLPWLIGLAVVGLAGAGYWWYRKKKREAALAVEDALPPKPAHEEALEALWELENRKLWQQGLIKQFYSEVTEIIRRYFERRYRILALEMTTPEIMHQLGRIPETEPLRRQIDEFLSIADLVKFAKMSPGAAEHENEMKTAYDIVRATVPVVRPEPAAAEAKEVAADAR